MVGERILFTKIVIGRKVEFFGGECRWNTPWQLDRTNQNQRCKTAPVTLRKMRKNNKTAHFYGL